MNDEENINSIPFCKLFSKCISWKLIQQFNYLQLDLICYIIAIVDRIELEGTLNLEHKEKYNIIISKFGYFCNIMEKIHICFDSVYTHIAILDKIQMFRYVNPNSQPYIILRIFNLKFPN